MSQNNIEMASSRIEESHTRLEKQLQQLIQTQSRHQSLILSGSVDASSREGRHTWMELGMLLREEGIPPGVILDNKHLLITTMKKALEVNIVLSGASSFCTALEFQSPSSIREFRRNEPQADVSLSLLSSAPAKNESFFDRSMASQTRPVSFLDQHGNVDESMQSLIEGMESRQLTSTPAAESKVSIGDFLGPENNVLW